MLKNKSEATMYPRDYKFVSDKHNQEPGQLEINTIVDQMKRDTVDGISVAEMGNTVIIKVKVEGENKIIVAKNFQQEDLKHEQQIGQA
jgi:hypothetical protein